MSTLGPTRRVVVDERTAPSDWDERAVGRPGGHVLQSATWGTYRATQGFEPHYLSLDDDHVALVLLRSSAGLPGTEAVVRRGPAHNDEIGTIAGEHAAALATWGRDVGARTLYLDPERPADPAYAAAMDAAGFGIADDIEPSIHVMRLELPPGTEAAAVHAGFSKSTRQRIRAAESAGTTVSEDRSGERLDDFVVLMQERAQVVGMQLQQGADYLRGWRALIAADLARLLVADNDGELVGGLFLYRHGGIQATAYSADKASRRRDLPGTMHLVRATAIRDALAEGCRAIELGGVDLPGQRTKPEPGDSNRGLYEHKRGFGAEWLEREPARSIVLRPTVERMARVRRRTIDALRGMRR
jgi:lipid II:glycine glycyltransferase (peptidoglycan interpeptide bridge formation enzyme)